MGLAGTGERLTLLLWYSRVVYLGNLDSQGDSIVGSGYSVVQHVLTPQSELTQRILYIPPQQFNETVALLIHS